MYPPNSYANDPYQIYIRGKISQWANVIGQERQDFHLPETTLASQYILRNTVESLGEELRNDYEFEANKICDYVNQHSKEDQEIAQAADVANLVIDSLGISAALILYDALTWACSSKKTKGWAPLLVGGGILIGGGLIVWGLLEIFGGKKND